MLIAAAEEGAVTRHSEWMLSEAALEASITNQAERGSWPGRVICSSLLLVQSFTTVSFLHHQWGRQLRHLTCCCCLGWLRNLVGGALREDDEELIIYCGNRSCINFVFKANEVRSCMSWFWTIMAGFEILLRSKKCLSRRNHDSWLSLCHFVLLISGNFFRARTNWNERLNLYCE